MEILPFNHGIKKIISEYIEFERIYHREFNDKTELVKKVADRSGKIEGYEYFHSPEGFWMLRGGGIFNILPRHRFIIV